MAEIKDIDIEQTELIDTPMDEEGVDEIVDEETTMEDTFSDSLVDEKNKKVKKKKTEKGKFRIWNFSRRILALCLLPMVITCVVVTKISTGVMKDIIENEVENAMRVAAVSIDETYTNLYKGDYTRNADGAVMKGGKKISGDKKLVDAMADTTGYNVTMMFGNMRLLTTVKSSSGSRANGTGVSDSLYAEIEKGEPIFLKDTVIIQTHCYAYYKPLVNSDGSVFGAVEIAMDSKVVQDKISKETRKLVVFSIAVVIFVAILIIIISRGIVAKMEQIKRFLDRIIDGKLDHTPNKRSLKANDELGDVYRSSVKLQGTVHDMVGGIKNSSDNLKVSADDLSGMAYDTSLSAEEVQQAIERISEGARVQADSTNEARNSILMINQQIEQIINEVDIMAQNAHEMSLKEKESEAIIEELANSCDDTKISVSKAAEQITLMSNAINDIKAAIQLIQSIADETDLLSLNANIEAAKAGAAGRGFVVVADQISKLAVQSNESSQDIQKIIDNLLLITERAVAVMGEVNDKMDIQQQKLILTKKTYQAVSDGVVESIDNMENIKEKIDILNASGVAISNAVDELSRVSEENADSAADTIMSVKDMNDTMQQVQASSEELLNMADELQKMLGVYDI